MKVEIAFSLLATRSVHVFGHGRAARRWMGRPTDRPTDQRSRKKCSPKSSQMGWERCITAARPSLMAASKSLTPRERRPLPRNAGSEKAPFFRAPIDRRFGHLRRRRRRRRRYDASVEIADWNRARSSRAQCVWVTYEPSAVVREDDRPYVYVSNGPGRGRGRLLLHSRSNGDRIG